MSAFKSLFRAISAICLSGLVIALTGCAGLGSSSDDFITPPRAAGEMYNIQETLEKTINGEYKLKYPISGKNRSAYILADITGSGMQDFALAFYSTTEAENSVIMHMNLMKKSNGKWISLSDTAVNASGVDKVEIIDFNGDGVKEITVGWSIYGAIDKKLNVYSLDGAKLKSLLQQDYTNYICCDLNQNGKNELFLLDHDAEASIAVAAICGFDKDGVNQRISCDIDGAVTSFNEPQLSKMSNGRHAIYVDAIKGSAMQTEIIYLKDGKLYAPMYTSGSQDASPTYRETSVTCFDVNSDGCLDIPSIESLDMFSSNVDQDELVPVTRWKTYTGNAFSYTMTTLMNYTDGYFMELPDNWDSKVIITKKIESRLRVISLWDFNQNTVLSELVRIQAIPAKDWDKANNGYNEYSEITRAKGIVYAAMFGNMGGKASISMAELKSKFHIIS